MKILFVVSRPVEINTSASIRNRAMIQGLIDIGHSVDYITSVPDKNHSNYDEDLSPNTDNKTYIKIGGIQQAARVGRKLKFLKRIKTLVYKQLESRNIYDNLAGICNYANTDVVDLNQYDVVISSSDPKSSHLFVSTFFEKYEKKVAWYQIWGDPFFGDITSDLDETKKLKIIQEEEKLLKQADKIFYVSKPTLYFQKDQFADYSDKMKYIPIPYESEIIYKNKEIDSNTRLKFLYAGDYNQNVRDIRPLISAFSKTNHNLLICGDSDLELKDTENIKILGRQNYKIIKEYEEKCDVLVHLSNKKGTQIPGKIYQYLGTNKPILFIKDGDSELIMSNFSELEDRFILCDNDSTSIRKKIDSISIGTYAPVSSYDKKAVAKQIIKNV